jgi:hypothetical protein
VTDVVGVGETDRKGIEELSGEGVVDDCGDGDGT